METLIIFACGALAAIFTFSATSFILVRSGVLKQQEELDRKLKEFDTKLIDLEYRTITTYCKPHSERLERLEEHANHIGACVEELESRVTDAKNELEILDKQTSGFRLMIQRLNDEQKQHKRKLDVIEGVRSISLDKVKGDW